MVSFVISFVSEDIFPLESVAVIKIVINPSLKLLKSAGSASILQFPVSSAVTVFTGVNLSPFLSVKSIVSVASGAACPLNVTALASASFTTLSSAIFGSFNTTGAVILIIDKAALLGVALSSIT